MVKVSLIVGRASIVRRAPILPRFANSSKDAFLMYFVWEGQRYAFFYAFPWFQNVQYALITLINDVK